MNTRWAIWNWIKKQFAFSEERLDQNEADLRQKYFTTFVLLGVPTMFLYGVHNFIKGRFLLAAIITLVASVLIIGRYLQKDPIKGLKTYRACALIYFILLLYMAGLGGDGGSKILWIYTFPLIVIFILGVKEGLIWSCLLLLSVVCFISLEITGLAKYHYPLEFIVRLITTYSIVGAITAWFEYLRVTYRRRLIGEHKRFLDILEHSRDILYRRDLRSDAYQYISKSFSDHLGFSREEVKSMEYSGIEQLIHPDDREKHRNAIYCSVQEPMDKPDYRIIEYRMRHKDGTYYWFSDQIKIIYASDGQAQFLIGNNREITKERLIGQTLKDTQEQFFTILNSIDAHIYVADMNTYEILFMNKKMKQDFGPNLEGKRCWKEFRNSEKPCDHCSNRSLVDSSGLPTGLFEWECFNPKTGRWYNNYDRAIQWSDGQLVRIQIAVDITRIKELEEERQRNEQSIQKARQIEAIGTLAGGMAHDFNNLLQVIVGNLSLLEFQTAPSHGSADHVHAIHTACAKATQLANRLITFSAGGSPHRVLMAITPLLQTIALAQTRETGIVCDFNLSEALWPTTIDQDQISLVFENLISNARESMNNTGRLVIATSNFTQEDSNTPEMPPGRYVQITIKDNGCGIPEREIPKIFEPYYSTKVRNAQKGMGLGLSIAYSIVRKHYGTIDLQSTPGVGTTVNIYLPTGATDA